MRALGGSLLDVDGEQHGLLNGLNSMNSPVGHILNCDLSFFAIPGRPFSLELQLMAAVCDWAVVSACQSISIGAKVTF